MDETTKKEAPKSPVDIVVTDTDAENVNADVPTKQAIEDDTVSANAEAHTVESNPEEASRAVQDTASAKDEENSKGRRLERKESVAVQKMDNVHNWLTEMDDKEIKLEDIFISKIQYIALCNSFQKYLNELKADESMARTSFEFSKLFDKFRACFAWSQKNINKVTELKVAKSVAEEEKRKMANALKDEKKKATHFGDLINVLKDKMVAVTEERQSLRSLVNELKDRMEKISEEQINVQSSPQTKGTSSLKNTDDEKDEKIITLEEALEDMRKEITFLQDRESSIQAKLNKEQKVNASLQGQLKSTKKELLKQTTAVEKGENRIAEKDTELEKGKMTIKKISAELEQYKSEMMLSKRKAKGLLNDYRKCRKDFDEASTVMEKLKRDLGIREDRIGALTTEKKSLSTDLSTKQKELFNLKADIIGITKERNELARRAAMFEERNNDAERTIESLKAMNKSQNQEMDAVRKDLAEVDTNIKELNKEKNVLIDEIQKSEQVLSELRLELKESEDQRISLIKELEVSKSQAEDLRDTMKRIERTKDNLSREIQQLNETITANQDEIKRLELSITNYKKTDLQLQQQLSEEITKHKVLSEEVRFFKKALNESKHQVEHLTDNQAVLANHIQQLKNYNEVLDENGKKLEHRNKNLVEQLGFCKEQHRQEVKLVEEQQDKLKRVQDDEQQLLKKLSDMDYEVNTLQRKVKNLSEEKDVLNSKLINKDKKITQCNDELHMMQQNSAAIDRKLNERVEEIKLLKTEVSRLNKANALRTKQLEIFQATREELAALGNKLFQEQLKNKAMEEEIQKTKNLHRWRILEGIDPDRAQLISKNQNLQKLLIKKTAELEHKVVELQTKEREAQELRESSQKRFEAGVQEELRTCRRELQNRTDRLKCLTGILSTVLDAIEYWNDEFNKCIRWTPREEEEDYVKFREGPMQVINELVLIVSFHG
ncbi:cilia- and flagella-associated protein 58-like [Uloborus diversus]|uniref:cilia- and flagella-associated protein 58-like n=1 Tax=Uloborus diversus TaxID=327109 RepID=UPI0024097BED|nr:cilia- and flagella-associated protein 58-like [Uloborus diversus]